jgi:hypothetical protein
VNSVGIIAGPEHISIETADSIEREMRHRNRGVWLKAHTEIFGDWDELVVFVTIPDDGDVFEPTRLNQLFDLIEEIIVRRMPHEVAIRDDRDTWHVIVSYNAPPERFAQVDSIQGGQGRASRTDRMSDGLGPPTRP